MGYLTYTVTYNRSHLTELRMQPLDPAVTRVWMIKGGLFIAFLLIVTIGIDIIRFIRGSAGIPGQWTLLVVAIGTPCIILLPRLKYRFWRYELREDELRTVRGILNRVHTIVPLRRVQHLDVSQDLIENNFNLGKLVVHTAGTRSSDVIVPGLRFEEATRLRDELRRYVTEHAV